MTVLVQADKCIDGKKVSLEILDSLKSEIESIKVKSQKIPGLAVILVGNNPASRVYVNHKKKACEKVGINSYEFKLDENVSEQELIDTIQTCNKDSKVDGILLQLPLPSHIDEQKMLGLIRVDKDVDGFHPTNVGNLLLDLPGFVSCTPQGVIELMRAYDIKAEGNHVVIIGRSNIVGKPLAALLLQRGPFANATVSVCHSKTKNLKEITKSADILIAAIGKPYFVTKDMIKPDCCIIDVGINRVEDSSFEKGSKLVGDVDFDSVIDSVSKITPVPGGVGPMTIAMLLKNTLQSFKERVG